MNNINLYELLGCNKESTTEQILAEYKAKVLDVHPDKYPENERAKIQDKFSELQYAKNILADPAKRRHYDAYLSLGTSMPLQEWMDNFERLKQTIHWVTNEDSQKMIDLPSNNANVKNKYPGWIRHESATVSAFRNYQI